MKIAVASGKGGTGKTTVAVGLAEALSELVEEGREARIPVRLLDCDVEEPNAHLFLGAEETGRRPFSLKVPEIDGEKCTACGKCVEFCNFNALMQLGSKVMVFENLCHGCGGCSILCPEGAIREVHRNIGEIVEGRVAAKPRGDTPLEKESAPRTGGKSAPGRAPIETLYGILEIGEALAPPLIRAVKREGGDYIFEKFRLRGNEDNTAGGETVEGESAEGQRTTVIVDSPPGTTCPMVTAVKDADFSLLVTENTPFGLHDLKLTVEILTEMNIPMGVVINRADIGHADVEEYCKEQGIPVLLRIPYDEAVASGYAKGRSIVSSVPRYGEEFRRLYRRIEENVQMRVQKGRGA